MAVYPIDETRETPDGPIRLTVSRDGDRWVAAITGPALECVRPFGTLEEANAWVLEAFQAMFPD